MTDVLITGLGPNGEDMRIPREGWIAATGMAPEGRTEAELVSAFVDVCVRIRDETAHTTAHDTPEKPS